MQSNTTQTTGSHAGVFHRWRVRFFGERDAVDAQLADIARQGSGMSRIAHACALAMIVLFSLGSLVTLSGDAVAAIVRGWQSAGAVDVPQAISVAVSGLLVLCLDTGMLLAASTLRVLRARRAPWSERWIHIAIMCGVALVEASTYALMSVTYDRPSSAAAWAIILARSLSAPILSVYLALAQPLPVGPRDILAQVELAAGAAVLRDVVAIAHDTSATLEHKARIYDASAVALESERARLRQLIAVSQCPDIPPMLARPSDGHYMPAYTGAGEASSTKTATEPSSAPEAVQAPTEPPTRPPTGGGSPIAAPAVRTPRRKASPDIIRLTPDRSARPAARARVSGVRTPRVDTASREAEARAAWANGAHTISAMRTATGMSKTAAASWVRTLKAELKASSADGRAAQ